MNSLSRFRFSPHSMFSSSLSSRATAGGLTLTPGMLNEIIGIC